jgi:hypothetical protein
MEKPNGQALINAVIYQLYADRLNTVDPDLDRLKKLLMQLYTKDNRAFFMDILDERYVHSLKAVEEHKELTGV